MTLNSLHGDDGYGHPGYGIPASPARPPTDGRASCADLPAGAGGRRLRAADAGQATGREAAHQAGDPRSLDTLGSDPTLPEAARQGPGQAERRQTGTSRPSPTGAAADRPPRGAHALDVPQVPQPGATLSLV